MSGGIKARHKRLALALAGTACLGLAAWFVLSAFQKNLVFFFTPSQIEAGEAPLNRSFRVGGMVEQGSLERLPDGMSYRFVVTDMARRVSVHYKGLLPDLFKEGKGVVAQGRLSGRQGHFIADEVLAKHDENYMPPEAAHAMEQARAARAAGTGGVAPGAQGVGGGRP